MSHHSARIIVESRDGVGWILLDHAPLNVITTAMAGVVLEDYHEGVAAFLEKRKPVWRHR